MATRLQTALLSLTLSPALLAQAPAVPPRPIEDVLPQSSYACLQMAGLHQITRAVDGLHMAELVHSVLEGIPAEVLDERVGRHLDRAADEVREALSRMGLAAADVRAVLRRPMAVGLGRLTLRGMGPSVALVVDEGQAGDSIDRVATALLQEVERQDRKFHRGEGTFAGLECRTLEHEEGPTILLARAEGLWILTNSEGYLREIVATAQGRQPGLSQATVLAEQRGRLGAPALLSAFVHTGPLLSTFDAHLPYEAGELGRALGVRSLDGVFLGTATDGGRTVELADWALQGEPDGLLKAAFRGEADFGAAKWCSADTVAFASFHLDVPAVIAAFPRLVEVLPQAAQREIRRNLPREMRRGFRRAGIQPEQLHELLRALDGTASVALMMENGVPIPDGLLLLGVEDRQVVAPWVERLAAQVADQGRFEWKTRRVGEHDVHYAEVHAGIALTPSWVLTDDYLVLGSRTRAVMHALEQRSQDGGLWSADDFARAAADFAGSGAFVHLRPQRAVELGWRPFEAMATAFLNANRDELGFDADVLPDQETVARALGTVTWGATVDAEGLRARSRGTLGLGAMLAFCGRMFDEILGRAESKIY